MKFVCENCKAKYQIGDDKVAGKTLRMKCRRCGNMIQVSSSVTESSVARANPAHAGELTGAELLLTGVHAAVAMPGAAAPGATEGPADLESREPAVPRHAPDDDSATVVRPSPLFLRNTGMGLPAAGAPRPSTPGPRAPSAPRIVPPARASVRPPSPGGPSSVRPASVAPPAGPAPASGGGASNLAVGFSRAVSSPPPAMAPDTTQTEDWYVGVGGVPLGPVRLSVIREKAAAGSVDGESLVWREGFDEWQPLKLFPVLLALVEDAKKRPAPVAPTPGRSSSSSGAFASPLATTPLTPSPAAGLTANGTNGAHAASPAPLADLAPATTSSLPGEAPLAVADPFRPSVAPVAVMNDPFAAPARTNGAGPSFASASASIPMSDSGGLGPSVIPSNAGAYGATDSVPPKPARKGVHPMAWAFIAMCAAFGGVAAWALFFRRSETQIVYQNGTAVSGSPTTGDGPGKPGAPGVEHGGDAHPSDPSVPTVDASGNPVAVNPGNPNYRVPGTSPSGAKSAKPDGTSPPDDYDPSGFDVGQTPGPKATGDNPTNTGKGNLSAGEIEGVVNRNKPSISRRCWDPAFDASDGKTKNAKVTASVTIGPSGAVTSVSASGGGSFPGLASCVQGSISGWRFPPADGESRTSIPFSFSKQ